MTTDSRTFVPIAIALGLAAANMAMAQCQYEAIPIPEPCNGAWTPLGLNGNEQPTVVGSQIGCDSANPRPFKWVSGAQPIYLTVPTGLGIAGARGQIVSDDGKIVGAANMLATSYDNLAVWNIDGSFQMFEPAGMPANVNSFALRSDGAVLGEYSNGFENGTKGYILKDGVYLPLPAVLAKTQGGFWDVNRSGLATGRQFAESWNDAQPFLWDGTNPVELLGLPAGHSYAWPDKIDCLGRVAGRARQIVRGNPIPPFSAFVWDSGKYTLLGTLPGHVDSRVSDSNDVGQIVGLSKPQSGSPRAYLWQHGEMKNLASVVVPALGEPFLGVYAINERGEITANTLQQMYLLRPLGIVPADVDLNCRVDAADIQAIFRSWGPVNARTPMRTDINSDGNVDAADLAEVLGNWTP